jgi:hypothetical protein
VPAGATNAWASQTRVRKVYCILGLEQCLVRGRWITYTALTRLRSGTVLLTTGDLITM